jgi:hypothetical protein
MLALSGLFAALLAAGAWFAPALGQQPGGSVPPVFVPNNTINVQPACRVARRLLCTAGNGSCGTGGVRLICSPGEKRVQIGASVYCDRWVCN